MTMKAAVQRLNALVTKESSILPLFETIELDGDAKLVFIAALKYDRVAAQARKWKAIANNLAVVLELELGTGKSTLASQIRSEGLEDG